MRHGPATPGGSAIGNRGRGTVHTGGKVPVRFSVMIETIPCTSPGHESSPIAGTSTVSAVLVPAPDRYGTVPMPSLILRL